MAESVSLDTVKTGEKVEVLSLTGEAQIKKRMTEMGLTKGTQIVIDRIAPLGDPIDIKVRGYHLSLRKEEAAYIMVKKL